MCYSNIREENRRLRTKVRPSWVGDGELAVLFCSESLFGFGIGVGSLLVHVWRAGQAYGNKRLLFGSAGIVL